MTNFMVVLNNTVTNTEEIREKSQNKPFHGLLNLIDYSDSKSKK